MFFPSHEDVVPLRQVRDVQVPFLGALLKRPEGRELSPMLQVDFVIDAPILVLCEEGVL